MGIFNNSSAIMKPAVIGPGPSEKLVNRAAENFEEASLDGDVNRMDRIADMLARRAATDTPAGRRLSRLDRALDRLASNKGQPKLSKSERDLVQRLRTGLAAKQQSYDGLKGPLGDISAKDLAAAGSKLLEKLESQGHHHYANSLRSAMTEVAGKDAMVKEPVDNNNLDMLAKDFEEASAAGDGAKMDSIVDQLAEQVRTDGSPRDNKLSELEQRLDKLGGMMRKFESMFEHFGSEKGAQKFDKFNDTIQRLRTAVLGATDGADGLKSALGDAPLDELFKDGQALLKGMKKGPMKKMSPYVEQALEMLKGMMNRDETYGKTENDQYLHRPRSFDVVFQPFQDAQRTQEG